MAKLVSVSFLVLALVAGCASVSVIQPVAIQNSRNADALDKNLQAFFEADEPFFQAVIQAQLIDDYREVIRSIQANDNPGSNAPDTMAEFYKSEASVLQDKVKDLTEESRDNEILRYYQERPLTAEVAFGGMLPKVAAAKWIVFEAIHRSKGLSAEERFDLYKKRFRDLSVLERKEKAATDLLIAYRKRKTVILEQSTNAKEIAKQLVAASNASYDAGKFLRGVLENDDLISGIAQYVLDPERKKAAEDLLETITSDKRK